MYSYQSFSNKQHYAITKNEYYGCYLFILIPTICFIKETRKKAERSHELCHSGKESNLFLHLFYLSCICFTLIGIGLDEFGNLSVRKVIEKKAVLCYHYRKLKVQVLRCLSFTHYETPLENMSQM